MQPPGFLVCNALLDAFINAAVSFQQLLVMLVDIRGHGVELLVRKTGHGSVDVSEVVATMKIVKDVHDRQAMPFNLRPSAEIDNSNRRRFHRSSFRQSGLACPWD